MTQLIADIRPPTVDTSGLNPEGVTRLTVIASPTLNQDQLWKLFDLIPGLDYCDLRKDHKSGQVYYHSCVTAGQGEGGRAAGGTSVGVSGVLHGQGDTILTPHTAHCL